MKPHTWVKRLLYVVIVLVIVALIGYLYIDSGAYNVAATEPHMNLTESFLDMMVTASIQNHAEGISVPQQIDSTAGFAHFDHMCVDCHSAPGIGRAEFGQGLYPLGPTMNDAVPNWTDQELSWVVKNGIKMTGMPAFGPTHTDDEIWSIVAFIRKMPEMGYYDYLELQDSPQHDGHEH